MTNKKRQQRYRGNWFHSRRIFFIAGVALAGSLLVIASLAAGRPSYFGNSEYWMGRIRACESGNGTWGAENYNWTNETLGTSGAYQYSKLGWDNFGGFSEAWMAPPVVQDDKFKMDWDNPALGSRQWERSMDCWKPAGIIAGAPCLPVPKTPTKAELKEREVELLEERDGHTDAGLCCGPGTEFNAPEGYELAPGVEKLYKEDSN